MKKYRRKIISLLLTAAMLITAVPILAAPDGDDYPSAPDEIAQTEATAAEAAEAETTETILTTEPEIEAIDTAANDGIEPAAELATAAPTLDPKKEAIYIVGANFREHPSTSSIFDEEVPNKLLWVEFSNRIDHSADFDQKSRTYTLDGKYYQLVVKRPEHGPKDSPHPAATMIPDNGIEGGISDLVTTDNTKHRYHGWQLGTDEMFDKDDTPEYQVGEYTVSLMRLYPGDNEKEGEALMNCKNRALVNEKTLNIVQITYTLSENDKNNGYKLICANHPGEKQTEITELAMVGDWITIIDPSLDCSEAQAKNVSISGWKIVKSDAENENAGATVPAGNKDGTDDNRITLEAVLKAPADYSYQYQRNADDESTSAFPTAPPATSEAPNPTAPPASYNMLAGDGSTPKNIEYEADTTIEPLTLRLVNTGNQRSYIPVYSSNDTFTVKVKNLNTDDEAKKSYADGGLDANKTLFYIPSKADIKNGHSNWKNYAIVEITPKKGLSVGTHHGQICSYNSTSRYLVPQKYDIDITISTKEVDIEPQSTTKPYGKELTAADIICDVYNRNGEKLETAKTAAELGVVVQSEGMSADAAVNGGQPYTFTIGEGQSFGNYNVKLKEGSNTGITVEKATPKLHNVKATAVNDGTKLSTSHLSGGYINPDSHLSVEGTLEWVNPEYVIPAGTMGTIQQQYQFKPSDKENYNDPAPASVTITVSSRADSNLTLSSLDKTYNGQEQKPTVRWSRPGSIEIGTNVDVFYKKIESDADREFGADEQFDEGNGYLAQAPKEAGVYKVHAETSANSDYYAPDSANAIMTIKPYTLELSLKSGSVKNKMYDGTTTAEIDPSKVGFRKKAVASDDVSVKASAFTASFSSAYIEPFSPKIVTVNVNGENALEGKDAANYTLATAKLSTTGYISIQRPIKLELKNTITKHYGETYSFTANDYKAAEIQPSPGGLAASDSIENVRATLKAEKNGVDGAAANAPVGEYTVTASALKTDNYNYEITSDALGTLSVLKTQPQEVSVNADNGLAGNTLQSLEDEHFTGTFQNPYNHEDVEGTIEWVDPNEVLSKDKSEYDYRFTPTDLENYEPVTGKIKIVVSDKEKAAIAEWSVPAAAPYDGQPRIATIKAESLNARTTVEYKKTDIEPRDMDDGDGWSPEPPVDAGTYLVRGTIYAYDDFADNSVEGTIEILRAEPKGSVTASNVNKWAHLSDSQLTADFTGVDNSPLVGEATWNTQDGVSPNLILVTSGTEYEWIFIPADKNYKPVTGKTTVGFNVDTRKAEAKIYNLPANYDELGDYAYVNVDGTNLRPGDSVRFYGDEEMSNPESSSFARTDEIQGWTLVNIDDDALNDQGGTLYLNIEGSTAVAPITYIAEIGFTLDPAQLYLKEGESADITVKKSDDSYDINSINWTLEQNDIAELQGDNSKVSITGTKDGSSRLTANAEFKHPDPEKADKSVAVSGNALVNVTAQEPPKYKYTTNDATDITETGATLNGHVEITLPEGSTINPVASCKFELWENGSDERTIYDSELFLRESGDYSVTVDGLKPGTEYCYRAFGAASDEEAETKMFTTGSTPVPTEAPSATPAPPTEAPSATPAPPTEAPSATPAPPTEAPATATPAPATEAPSATPAPVETATPAPATEVPSATPAPVETATPAPDETATPAPDETATPAPDETATPAPVETATPDPGAPVRYDAAPVLNNDTATATITNNSGKSVWFISAAYRNDVLIDIKFVEVPEGTNPVSAKLNADYSADNSVSVTFYLWEKDTLKPCADPVHGK